MPLTTSLKEVAPCFLLTYEGLIEIYKASAFKINYHCMSVLALWTYHCKHRINCFVKHEKDIYMVAGMCFNISLERAGDSAPGKYFLGLFCTKPAYPRTHFNSSYIA